MTFVAQPYNQFADDLLTALTGGITREEHRFSSADKSFSLERLDALPFSLKLYGQRNNQFVQFDAGIDYTYVAEQSMIAWMPEGRLPDEQSYFYVNYYTENARRRLTDRNPGSVTSLVAESFARQFAVLHQQMDMIYKSAFVDTATNAALDHVAALLGLLRKDAKFASGEVLFKRSTPAQGDITIAAGTLVSTAQGINFETSDERTLRRGQLSVIVPIRAQFEGTTGRVDSGTITNINRPIYGLEGVINEEATFFAAAKETDDEFRKRIKGVIERAGKATLESLRQNLIEDVPGVNEGNLQIREDPEVRGLVYLRFGLDHPDDPALVQRVEESIFNARPAGVRVVHNLPTRTLSDSEQRTGAQVEKLSRSLALSALAHSRLVHAAKEIPPDMLVKMPQDVLLLRAVVFLGLAQANLSIAQKEQIQDDARSRVVAFIESLPMGADLVYNKLLGKVVDADNIIDAYVSIGPLFADPDSLFHENLLTDNRKAKIDSGDVFVGLMDETVTVDVAIMLEPSNGQAASQIPTELNTRLTDALNRALISVTAVAANGIGDTPAALSREALQAAVKAALTSADTFQLVDGRALTMNASYEETGRLLSNTDQITLEVQQVPRLGTLALTVTGALDG